MLNIGEHLMARRKEGSATQRMSDIGSCCIYRQLFVDSTALKKRKRFYNDACLNARRFFNEVLSKRFQLSLDSFVETSDSYAFLCHVCDSQACKYVKYQDEIRKMEEVVVENLSHLTKLANTTDNTQGRRRSSIGASIVAKRVRMASELQDNVMPTGVQLTTGQSGENLPSNSQHSRSPDVSVSGAFCSCVGVVVWY